MKIKFLFYAAAVFFCAAVLFAAPRQIINGVPYPELPGQLVSQAVYRSSVTCANVNILGLEVNVSSRAGYLYGIAITTPGITNAGVELFDSRASTSAGAKLTGQISAQGMWMFNLAYSTGLTIRNYGDVSAPCATVIYSEK